MIAPRSKAQHYSMLPARLTTTMPTAARMATLLLDVGMPSLTMLLELLHSVTRESSPKELMT